MGNSADEGDLLLPNKPVDGAPLFPKNEVVLPPKLPNKGIPVVGFLSLLGSLLWLNITKFSIKLYNNSQDKPP